jgi:hypothetical protein
MRVVCDFLEFSHCRADIWDALRFDRLYHISWPVEKVREHLRSQAGPHFDPHAVTVCLDSDFIVDCDDTGSGKNGALNVKKLSLAAKRHSTARVKGSSPKKGSFSGSSSFGLSADSRESLC